MGSSFADVAEILSLTVTCAFTFEKLSVVLTGKTASLCEADVGSCAISPGRIEVTTGSPVTEVFVVMLTDPVWRAGETVVGDVRNAAGVVLRGWTTSVVFE